jgi:predicted type IV restriction endonuclease
MNIANAVQKILNSAKKLNGAAGNEANTKALLIEPLLAVIGWDVGDVDQVVREVRVFDGTALDYALKIDGDAVLYVEAKAAGKSLDDKQFIAQTVNYANNEGVV